MRPDIPVRAAMRRPGSAYRALLAETVRTHSFPVVLHGVARRLAAAYWHGPARNRVP